MEGYTTKEQQVLDSIRSQKAKELYQKITEKHEMSVNASMHESGLHTRSVAQYCLSLLERNNLIRRVYRKGKKTVYQLPLRDEKNV